MCVCRLIVVDLVVGREMDERTLVYFADSPLHILKAYVENGEGFDRAGGFAVQVRSDHLFLVHLGVHAASLYRVLEAFSFARSMGITTTSSDFLERRFSNF